MYNNHNLMSKVCLEITGNIMQLFIIYNETDIPWKMTKSHIVHLWFWQYDCYCGVLQHVRVLFFCPVDFRNFTDMISPSKDIIWPMKCLTDFFIV